RTTRCRATKRRRSESRVSTRSRTRGIATGFARAVIGGCGESRMTRDSRHASERARRVASVTLMPHYWLSAGRTAEVGNGFCRLILGLQLGPNLARRMAQNVRRAAVSPPTGAVPMKPWALVVIATAAISGCTETEALQSSTIGLT